MEQKDFAVADALINEAGEMSWEDGMQAINDFYTSPEASPTAGDQDSQAMEGGEFATLLQDVEEDGAHDAADHGYPAGADNQTLPDQIMAVQNAGEEQNDDVNVQNTNVGAQVGTQHEFVGDQVIPQHSLDDGQPHTNPKARGSSLSNNDPEESYDNPPTSKRATTWPLGSPGQKDLVSHSKTRVPSQNFPSNAASTTMPREHDQSPPSSEGKKSSLLEEMRTEEQRVNRLESLKAAVPNPVDREDVSVDDSDLSSSVDMDAPTSPVNFTERLITAAAKKSDDTSPQDRLMQSLASSPPAAFKPGFFSSEPPTSVLLGFEQKKSESINKTAQDDSFNAPEAQQESTNDSAEAQREREQDKQFENLKRKLDSWNQAAKQSKKARLEPYAPSTDESVPDTDANVTAEGETRSRPLKPALGGSEMKGLQYGFLGAPTASGSRKTRAKKKEEDENAPNAGKAAKARHQGKKKGS